eukprot:SAG11_NODE_743_length_7407_cov_2.941434_2_plen_85_part_00
MKRCERQPGRGHIISQLALATHAWAKMLFSACTRHCSSRWRCWKVLKRGMKRRTRCTLLKQLVLEHQLIQQSIVGLFRAMIPNL